MTIGTSAASSIRPIFPTMMGDESASDVRASSGEDSGVGAEGQEVIETEEETKPKHTPKTPEMPTQSQMDKHHIDHLPYREWCPECVEGFGREWRHMSSSKQRSIPLISCDYLFVTTRGVFM